MYDIAIIGAGVVGAAVARELGRYDLRIALLEKGNDVALGATKANSAIVHAGYDAEFGTLMGALNVEGNRLFAGVCEELAVPFRRVGSLVCAFDGEETAHLRKLLENGLKLGVPGLALLDGAAARTVEPGLAPGVTAALYAPTAGITVPWELAIAYAENAVDNGVELKLDFEVVAVTREGTGFRLSSRDASIEAACVVNCAGVAADKVFAAAAGASDFSIKPRRGQYFLLDKSAEGLVRTVVFPAPSRLGKGTLVTPTIDGNVLVGPDAEDLGDEAREHTATSAEGLARVRAMAERLVPGIPYQAVITTFAGVRAEPSRGDFIIEESSLPGFVNVAGIKSPGLSSAPAIAARVVGIVAGILPAMPPRPDFSPRRRPRPVMESLGPEERAARIAADPRFGNVVCRCEMVTEGEIVDAIHRPAGARTLNGVKRRVRPGAGRCQGGFCSPRVLAILARELGVPPTAVRLESKAAVVLVGESGRERK